MARALSQTIQDQIDDGHLKKTHTLTVGGVDRTTSLVRWKVSIDREFGASSGQFDLVNDSGEFGDGGANEIQIGDTVQLIEQFGGDSTQWKRFFGQVVQRSITKSSSHVAITLTCLDFIATLQALDIDLEVEGTKVEVTNETLTPNFLPSPNESLAQVFDFSRNAIAQIPPPILNIFDRTNSLDNLQFDGFEINYDEGQVTLGSPINALNNYDLKAFSYSYYIVGIFIEDILEQILTQVDGYGSFLFGESSAADVITNHLQDTFLNVEASSEDVMTPNSLSSTIQIRHSVASSVSAGTTSVTLDSTEGLPTSGTGEISGDIFTWASVDSGNVLSGIPSSGGNALKDHDSGDVFIYENTYDAGQVWSLTYSNLVTTLTDSDFTFPSGSTISYVDKRFGRIILDAAISTLAIVKCTTNYTFKTLQASGVELNRISFRSREVENRFKAIEKLRQYVAPNYVIRTLGDDKIWSSYLTQKTVADYTLELIKDINYLEDDDLFTRTILYAKNSNPTNVMFGNAVEFETTGESFRAIASNTELSLFEDSGNFLVYGSLLSGIGYIDLEFITPVVFINGVAIDNRVHELNQQSVLIELTTRTETKTGCHGISKERYFKSHTYFYYKVYFPHASIEPSSAIRLHNINGSTIFTLSPNDPNVDYARGVWHVPGDEENSAIATISTATYSILYSTNLLVIDYDNVLFAIHKNLISNASTTTITATFQYWTVFTSAFDVAAIIDGRFDTQVQTEFFAEPPSGFPLAILDLGQSFNIQALDIIAGFYQPEDNRKFDIDMRISIQYSLNGTDFFPIGDATDNIKLTGGESASFEEDDLGANFNARYLKLSVEQVKKIAFGANGRWVVAFTEMAAYNNIVIKGESTLIATTQLGQDVTASSGSQDITVVSTAGFTAPESSEEITAYIDGDSFTYTGLTATQFEGVTGLDSDKTENDRVHQAIEGDTTLYDDDGLLPRLGDRIFKDILISDRAAFSQTQINTLSRNFLREFYKQHTRRKISILYAPHLQVGQTISLTESSNNETNVRYFIESISDNTTNYSIIVARYPAT